MADRYNPFSTIPPPPFTAVGPVYFSLPPNGSYYNVPAEFPTDSLKTLLRWVNFAWAFAPNNIASVIAPP